MGKQQDFALAPMMLAKYTNNFEVLDFAQPLNGSFDMTNYLTTWQQEATAKQMAVMIQVALIPLDVFWGTDETETEEETND